MEPRYRFPCTVLYCTDRYSQASLICCKLKQSAAEAQTEARRLENEAYRLASSEVRSKWTTMIDIADGFTRLIMHAGYNTISAEQSLFLYKDQR